MYSPMVVGTGGIIIEEGRDGGNRTLVRSRDYSDFL